MQAQVQTATQVNPGQVEVERESATDAIRRIVRDGEECTYTSPMGTITDTGIELIREVLTANGLPIPGKCKDGGIEYTWVTARGTFPKRLGKWLKKQTGQKTDESILSSIGNIARTNSEDGGTYFFDIVDHADWGRSDFGQCSSCWWSDGAHEAFIEQGGLAMRLFKHHEFNPRYSWDTNSDSLECSKCGLTEDAHGGPEVKPEFTIANGYGRAWLFPFRKNRTALLFNGYGTSNGALNFARILSGYLGVSYHKVTVNDPPGFYMNSSTEYLIGSDEDIEKHISQRGRINLPIEHGPRYPCSACGSGMDEDDGIYPEWGDGIYCESCYSELFAHCERCESDMRSEDAREVHIRNRYAGLHEVTWCDDCTRNNAVECEDCDDYFEIDETINTEDAGILCFACGSDVNQCETCGEYFRETVEINGNNYCPDCAEDAKVCAHCERSKFEDEDGREIATHDISGNRILCDDCFHNPATARMRDERTLNLFPATQFSRHCPVCSEYFPVTDNDIAIGNDPNSCPGCAAKHGELFPRTFAPMDHETRVFYARNGN